MNQSSYESEIREHYGSFHLDDELVDQILDAGQFAASARRWKQIAIGASIGLAAMIVLTIGLLLNSSSENQPVAKFKNSPEKIINSEQNMTGALIGMDDDRKDQKTVNVTDEKGAGSSETYRLVAFRSHSNACPHCRATGIVYHELEETLDDTPLEFVEFNLGDAASRQKTDQAINQLHLTPLIDGRSETAFITLTGLNGKPIQEFKPSMGSEKIAQQVRKLMQR
ncbi:hypothetical protein [uncultured Gimesia sp.]|uniref:hypothetical protein n=1 Tax=uncultured Gimesia sp. TaxID=1678688 RepID=UPI0026338629|nr:hypothetical protein [uncultured Gimesia sp.]